MFIELISHLNAVKRVCSVRWRPPALVVCYHDARVAEQISLMFHWQQHHPTTSPLAVTLHSAARSQYLIR